MAKYSDYNIDVLGLIDIDGEDLILSFPKVFSFNETGSRKSITSQVALTHLRYLKVTNMDVAGSS